MRTTKLAALVCFCEFGSAQEMEDDGWTDTLPAEKRVETRCAAEESRRETLVAAWAIRRARRRRFCALRVRRALSRKMQQRRSATIAMAAEADTPITVVVGGLPPRRSAD